jgi:hypothetical protein
LFPNGSRGLRISNSQGYNTKVESNNIGSFFCPTASVGEYKANFAAAGFQIRMGYFALPRYKRIMVNVQRLKSSSIFSAD